MIIRPCGDTMLLVEFEQVVDPIVNQRTIALASRLSTRLGHRVRDIVPGYCSVGIHYDPLLTDIVQLEQVIDDEASMLRDDEAPSSAPIVEIPVRYGGAEGPDLEGVAEWAECTIDDVIERHTDRTYRVYMLGFVPGFAYMGRVDPSIAAPRHRVPRERVPTGSVGIAGVQTGVYPMTTPGGWRLIGRTDTVMFEATRANPNLVRPGDMVRFVPVSLSR